MFFSKIKLSLDNKENYNANTDKIENISIDITIGVPNYFNYLQRKIIQKFLILIYFQRKKLINIIVLKTREIYLENIIFN